MLGRQGDRAHGYQPLLSKIVDKNYWNTNNEMIISVGLKSLWCRTEISQEQKLSERIKEEDVRNMKKDSDLMWANCQKSFKSNFSRRPSMFRGIRLCLLFCWLFLMLFTTAAKDNLVQFVCASEFLISTCRPWISRKVWWTDLFCSLKFSSYWVAACLDLYLEHNYFKI